MTAPTPLAALREALAKATPGPWHVNLRRLVRASDRTVAEVFYADANADLIALLRNHADALLAVAEAGRRLSIAEAALQAALADNLVGYIPCEITQEARDALAGLRTALSALDGEGR